MFLVSIRYAAPFSEIEAVRPAHRAWLRELGDRGLVLIDAPLDDRSGGIVVTHHDSRAALDRDLADDPYLVAGIARHEVAAFSPSLLGSMPPEG